MPLYGFDEESARRIGHAVRLVEGGKTPSRGAGGQRQYVSGGGVRCMLERSPRQLGAKSRHLP